PSIQIIRRQRKPVFGRKFGQRFIGGFFETLVRRAQRLRNRRRKLHAVFCLHFQTDRAFLLTITIDELLRHHRAQPAFERPAAGIEHELRAADSIARVHSIQIGEQGIGQLGGVYAVARNVQRHAVQLLPVAADEVLPRPLVSGRTGARQHQFFQTQRGAKVSFLLHFLFYRRVGGIQKIFAQNFIEDGGKLLGAHAVSHSPAALIKSRGEICSRAGLGGAWHFTLARPDDASNFFGARKNKSYVLGSASRERHFWKTRGWVPRHTRSSCRAPPPHQAKT